jgi:hypothetical protein
MEVILVQIIFYGSDFNVAEVLDTIQIAQEDFSPWKVI